VTTADAPTASIVVRALDARATLPACLSSLQCLTYPRSRLEVLVVDNGSTDDTAGIAESFGVRVVAERMRGHASAANRGLASARGDIVAFIDADCVAEPDWLTALVGPLQDPGVGASGGRIRTLHHNTVVELFGDQVHDQRAAILVDRPPYVILANCAFPRRLLRELGGFDSTLGRGEDVDLAWRMLQRGLRLAYEPRAVVRHQNAHTLRALFGTGVKHGFASIALRRKHAPFLAASGCPRLDLSLYRSIAGHLRASLATRSSRALCALTFDGGKALGRAAGAIRYGYPAV
jgi:cellulose synthase/poly-beta-1,6-N-acetylglucosamine synthase-like glycosyltransferase